MDINGGSITFKSTLDNRDAKKASKELEDNFKKLGNSASKIGDVIEDVAKQSAEQIRASLDNINKDIEFNAQKLEELNAEYAKVGKEGADAFMKGNDEFYRQSQEKQRVLKEEINSLNQEQKALEEQRLSQEKNLRILEQENKVREEQTERQKSLMMQIRELRNEMAQLDAEGKRNTEEYAQLAAKAGELQDIYSDTQTTIRGLASDTANLDAVLSLASGATGGFSALTGGMQLFGAESERVEEAQTKLQAAIALATGVQQVQNVLQKESALMLGINKIQTLALAKAKALETKSTIAATVAQKAFNIVAKANPYVLLAMALVTVVGALAAFTLGSNKAAEQEQKLVDIEANHLDYLEKIADEENKIREQRIHSYENELKVAKARNASVKEQQAIEDKIYRERVSQNAWQRGYYAQEIEDLEKNTDSLGTYRDMLQQVLDLKAKGDKKVKIDIDLDGKIDKLKIDEAISILQGRVDNYGKKIEVATTLKQEQADLEAERKAQLASRQREAAERAKETARTEREVLRETETMRLNLIKDSYEREKSLRKAETKRAIEDIKIRLKQEKNLTAKARQSLNEQIKILEEQQARDLRQMRYQRQIKMLEVRRKTADDELSLIKDSYDKQRAELHQKFEREKQDTMIQIQTNPDLNEEELDALYKHMEYLDIKYAQDSARLEEEIKKQTLETEKETLNLRLELTREGSAERLAIQEQILEKERKIALQENKLLAEDQRQSEDDINRVYDTKRATLLAKASKEWEALFGDIASMSKQQMNDAIKRIKQIIDYVEGVRKDAPEGVSQELLENIKKSPEALKEVYDKLLELQKSFNEESGYPFASIVQGLKKIKQGKDSLKIEKDADKIKIAQDNIKEGNKDLIEGGAEVIGVFGSLGDKLQELGEDIDDASLKDLGKQLSDISSLAQSVVSGFATGGTTGAIISGAVTLIGQIAESFMESKKEAYEARQRTEEFQDALVLLNLTMQDIYNNSFGERTFRRLADASNIAYRALKKYNQAIKDYNDSRSIYIYKGGRGSQAEASILRETENSLRLMGFGNLYNENGELDIEGLKSYLDIYGESLDKTTKHQLEMVIELKEAYDEAAESVRGFIEDTFGYLGDEAVDALTKAIENGADAWETFRKSGAKAIESLGEQLTYELFLASHFEDFQKQLERIYGIGEYTSDAEREYYQGMTPEEKADEVMKQQDNFFNGMQSAMEAGQAFMESYKERANQYGWDLWDSTSTTSLTGSVKNITEESASLIAGHLNAIRIMSAEANQALESQLFYLADISRNTSYLRTMDSRLRNIESSMVGGNYSRRLMQ